jgi:hypothetical protein
MTVAELIAELAKLDPNSTVIVIDNSSTPPQPYPVLCCTEYNSGEITIEY